MRHLKFIFVILMVSGAIIPQAEALSQIIEEPILLRAKNCDIQGTLMLPPSGKASRVVLIVPDAGAVDRNGNQHMMYNNSLKMYATALAMNNIASVRYDKRGVAASRASCNTDIDFSTYVSDVKEWIKLLNSDTRFSKVIVAGHSEGALVSLAAVNKGAQVDGYISIAGMGQTFDLILKDRFANESEQVKHIVYDIIDSLKVGKMRRDIPIFLRNTFSVSIQPYLISLMDYDPQNLIKQVHQPILLLQGDTDLQIKVDDVKMLFEAAKKAKMIIIKGMNHLMKECLSMDKKKQFETFIDPSYPLVPQVVDESTRFINAL